MGATCPLAQGTLQDGLSTWHVKRSVKARLPASRAENRLNRQNMFEKITSTRIFAFTTKQVICESKKHRPSGGLTYMYRPKKYGFWALLV